MRPRRKFRGLAFAALALSAMACGSAKLASPDGGAGNAGASGTGGAAGAAGAKGAAGAAGAGGAAGAAGAAGAGGAAGAAGAAGAGGAAGKAGDGGADPCAASGTGSLGVLGCPCSSLGKLACNGNAQAVALLCSQGTWTLNQTCQGSNLCDSQGGTCQPIDPLCLVPASAGRNVCASAASIAQCGPDRVSHVAGQTCSGATPACLNGACVACAPSSTLPCGPCADGTETCGADGNWGACVGASSMHTYYRDTDGDGYGDPSSPKVVCGAAPAGYVADGTDCCDKDANAHPGQTGFFATPDACGSSQSPDGFDYNCNGKDDLQNANLNTHCVSSAGCASAGCATGVCCYQTDTVISCGGCTMYSEANPVCGSTFTFGGGGCQGAGGSGTLTQSCN